MKTNNLLGKVAAFVAIAMVGLIVSCKNDETLNGADATNAVSESLTDGYYEDVDDISLVAAGTATSPARVATDDRLMCNSNSNVTFLDGSNATAGGFVVDFGSGCTDSNDNVRTGKINVTYSGGPIGNEGFKIVITFLNYSINGIKLEGTRTITKLSSSEIKHSILLKDGKATWPVDGSYETREANFTRTVNVNDLTVTLDGSASGTNRDGKSYTMEITKPLVYKTSCAVINKIFMAVEGTKLFTNTDTNRTLTIDYGDGTCDKAISLTVGGKSFSYTVKK